MTIINAEHSCVVNIDNSRQTFSFSYGSYPNHNEIVLAYYPFAYERAVVIQMGKYESADKRAAVMEKAIDMVRAGADVIDFSLLNSY